MNIYNQSGPVRSQPLLIATKRNVGRNRLGSVSGTKSPDFRRLMNVLCPTAIRNEIESAVTLRWAHRGHRGSAGSERVTDQARLALTVLPLVRHSLRSLFIQLAPRLGPGLAVKLRGPVRGRPAAVSRARLGRQLTPAGAGTGRPAATVPVRPRQDTSRGRKSGS